MAHFKYQTRDKSGKRSKGNITASTKREAMQKLREKEVRILSIEEVPETIFNKEIYFGNPVKLQDFVIYLRQFATLLRAGVSIVESTRILSEQTSSKVLKKVLAEIEEDLRSGIALSESTAKHKKVFPPMFINMVKAGEVGGNMDDALDRVAIHFEKQHEIKKKVQSALSYPIVVAIIAVGVVMFLLANVVPTFAAMFEDFGGELPWITKFVLAASDWMKQYWWIVILFFILVYVTIMLIKRNKSSKYYLDYAILRVPIFGKIILKSLLARMTRTLSSLFTSSVPILQALSIAEKVVENEVLIKVLQEARKSLEKGQSLTEPMKKHWAFPPLVTQMIAIGEETGSLDAMLGKVADFYETEVNTATDSLKSLIEPLMIVFLAGIVGVIVLAIMIPMFEIFNQVNY